MERDHLCSRFPPNTEGVYPVVYEDDGCGEHPDFPAYLESLTLPKVQVDEVGSVATHVDPATPTTPINRAWLARFSTAMDKVAKSYTGGSYATLAVSDLIDVWDESEEVDPEFMDAFHAITDEAKLPDVAEMASTHDGELNGATDRLVEHLTRNGLISPDMEKNLGAIIKAKDEEIGRQSRVIASQRNTISLLEDDYQRIGEKYIAEQANAVEQAEVIARQVKTIGERSVEYATLRETIDNLRHATRLLQSAHVDRDKEEAEYKSKVEQLRKQVDGWKHELELSDGVGDMLRVEANKLRDEVTRLEELNDRQERGLDEARETIAVMDAGLATLRKSYDKLEGMNNDLHGEAVKRDKEHDLQVWRLSSELHAMVDAADDLNGQLSEARHEVADRNQSIDKWVEEVNRIDAKFEQANGRYQELAEAAQQVAEQWTGKFDPTKGQRWVERVQQLVNVIARHARPADEATQATPNKPNTPGSHFKPTSLYLTLNTADLEQRTREMAEKLLREHIQPIKDEARAVIMSGTNRYVLPDAREDWVAVPCRLLGRLERAVTGEPEPIATL